MSIKKSIKIGKNSKKYKFDWPNALEAIKKVEEELKELKEAIKKNGKIKEELGDSFFALIQVSRHLNIKPLEAISDSNKKFEKRFNLMLKLIKKDKKKIKKMNLNQMHLYWKKAKKSLKK